LNGITGENFSPILVIGAGPAGLALASRMGSEATVIDQLNEVGGLSRSIEMGDGVFDIGGHSFHTPHSEVEKFVRGLPGLTLADQPRDARIWFAGEMIPYPFQHNFQKLTANNVAAECQGHIVDQAALAQSRNFEDWIIRRFGKGISEYFMLPYNRKLWARDLKTMSCDWVSERVATAKESPNSSTRQRQPLQGDSRVSYPVTGGFGEIFKSLAKTCHQIELGQRVTSIDAKNRLVSTSSGKKWRYDKLVSTMPLPTLIACLGEEDEIPGALTKDLQAVSLKVLMLLVKLENKNVPQRVYIASSDVYAHKIAFNHTSSKSLSERTNHAIICEVSYSEFKETPSDEDLVQNVVSWLIGNNYIFSKNALVTSRVIDVPFGYPVYSHNRSDIVSTLTGHLESKNIFSIGRFGSWNYANSDECIRQGLELARHFSGKSD